LKLNPYLCIIGEIVLVGLSVIVTNAKAEVEQSSQKETLNKSFGKLSATAPCVALPPASMQSRTNGKALIPFVVSLSNHEQNQPVPSSSKITPGHVHKAMRHHDMMQHDLSLYKNNLEHNQPNQSQELKSGRDPHAYTNGKDFSGLTKPKMGDEDYLAALIVDRLEAVNVRDDFSTIYDWQAWYGKDYDKLLFRAEGEIEGGTFKNARNEALWAHALTAYWDTQVGVRIDSGLGTDRVWGAFGVQGFAPYWIYIEATAYVGEEGRTAFRLETEYDVLITQKLILQPRIEMNFYSQSDLSRLVSSGLSNIEAGLRLRYEFKREFAPYIGIEWANTFGAAADVIRAGGKNPEEPRFVAGVHFWF
jgi:copper resistance protein B